MEQQKIKLYTEKQVKNLLKEKTDFKEESIDIICKQLTAIELPTYNDIINEADQKPKYFYDNSNRDIFIEGCAWVVVILREKYEQILSQVK